MGEQSGVPKDSIIKVYHGYLNIDEIFKLLKKKRINRTPLVDTMAWSEYGLGEERSLYKTLHLSPKLSETSKSVIAFSFKELDENVGSIDR